MDNSTKLKDGLTQLGLNFLDFLNRITSRRFLGVVANVLIPIANSNFKWGLTDGQIFLITGAIVTYIIADTYEQTKAPVIISNNG